MLGIGGAARSAAPAAPSLHFQELPFFLQLQACDRVVAPCGAHGHMAIALAAHSKPAGAIDEDASTQHLGKARAP
eukprot:15463992-Alexandrium_andersonii.AAC.1